MQFRIQRHDQVDSTNELALRAIGAGTARHGDVHVARAQTAGRGRRGANWSSPAGEGLYLSLVLAPTAGLASVRLSMAAGLAVHDAVRSLGLARAQLKWPNDVLVAGAKLAGILIESRGLPPTAPMFVIGLGLNVLQREFPAELSAQRPVTSLALEGLAVSVDAVLQACLQTLAARLEQAQFRAEELGGQYLAAAGLTNADVDVKLTSSVVQGIAVGMDLETNCLRLDCGAQGTLQVPMEHVLGLGKRDRA